MVQSPGAYPKYTFREIARALTLTACISLFVTDVFILSLEARGRLDAPGRNSCAMGRRNDLQHTELSL